MAQREPNQTPSSNDDDNELLAFLMNHPDVVGIAEVTDAPPQPENGVVALPEPEPVPVPLKSPQELFFAPISDVVSRMQFAQILNSLASCYIFSTERGASNTNPNNEWYLAFGLVMGPPVPAARVNAYFVDPNPDPCFDGTVIANCPNLHEYFTDPVSFRIYVDKKLRPELRDAIARCVSHGHYIEPWQLDFRNWYRGHTNKEQQRLRIEADDNA
jgi:hypothetical protein